MRLDQDLHLKKLLGTNFSQNIDLIEYLYIVAEHFFFHGNFSCFIMGQYFYIGLFLSIQDYREFSRHLWLFMNIDDKVSDNGRKRKERIRSKY